MNSKDNQTYDGSSIDILKGLEAVRKRPGMYIGDSGTQGLHRLVWEITDNSVDEAMAGHCSEIAVVIEEDGETISVEDNGRGIPVDIHPTEGKPTLEVVLTQLHAGGKFGGSGYQASGGLHGVGASCVTALSELMIAQVRRDGQIHEMRFSKGEVKQPIKVIGPMKRGQSSGTRIQWKADVEIFKAGVRLDEKLLLNRLREIAYLNRNLKICFENKQTGTKHDFCYEGGISDYVAYLIEDDNSSYPQDPVFIEGEHDGIKVQISFAYTDSDDERILSFCNNINTIDGGTHTSAFKTAMTRVVNQFYKSIGGKKDKDENLTGGDVREGLVAIVSVLVSQPEFVGQTKAKLGTVEAEGATSAVVTDGLTAFFEKNAPIVKKIIERARLAQKARAAAKKSADAIKRRSVFGSGGGMPGKLYDCRSKKRELTELYIVEGDSAAGCLSGKTLIPLASGEKVRIDTLPDRISSGEELFCYNVDDNGKIVISKIQDAFLSKTSTEMIRIKTDSGGVLECTPCHRIMLRNGSYKKAEDLKENDRLMPWRVKLSDTNEENITINGYEMVYQPNYDCLNIHEWIFTHCLSDEWNVKNNKYEDEHLTQKHHIDFNKLNNNPNNIIRMTREAHFALHLLNLDKTLHSDESKEKAKVAKQSPAFRRKMSSIMKKSKSAKGKLAERNEMQWSDPSYIKKMKDAFKKWRDENPEKHLYIMEKMREARDEFFANGGKEKISKLTKEFMNQDHIKDIWSQRSKEQWDNAELLEWRSKKTKQDWKDPRFRNKQIKSREKNNRENIESFLLCWFTQNPCNKSRSSKSPVSITCPNVRARFWRYANKYHNNDRFAAYDYITKQNCKVISVERYNRTEPVYDLQIQGSPNFAISEGFFVHNSAKGGRNSDTQAIMPIRGKMINAEKHSGSAILKNKEVTDLIAAVGTGIKDDFDIEKLRYDKIIIMADADDDGCHIATLLMAFFFRYMKPLVTGGHLYMALPPLYAVRKGQKVTYCWTEEDKEKALRENGGTVTRFKGLGEMDEEQLGETTMEPSNRRLLQLCITDQAEAEKVVSVLMGSNVAARKERIQRNIRNIV